MAIPGIGLLTTTQFAPRSAEQRGNAQKNENQTAITVSNEAAQTTNSKATAFAPVPASTNSNKSTTSRQDLAELETLRNRFQLQQESKTPQGESGKALQSFLDVADFERKDELTSLYGFDIII